MDSATDSRRMISYAEVPGVISAISLNVVIELCEKALLVVALLFDQAGETSRFVTQAGLARKARVKGATLGLSPQWRRTGDVALGTFTFPNFCVAQVRHRI